MEEKIIEQFTKEKEDIEDVEVEVKSTCTVDNPVTDISWNNSINNE